MNYIEMGTQAGLCDEEGRDDNSIIITGHLERFAALVVANIDPKSFMSWQEGYEAGKQNEREECAKLCDEVGKESLSHWPARFANMIRARGEV